MSNHFLGSWVSVHVVLDLEEKHHIGKCPSSSSCSLRSDCEQTSCDMEYPFGQCGSAVLPVLPTPNPLVRGDSLDAVSPAVTRTLVCYQHLSSYKYKPQHYEGCGGEK